MSWGKGIIIFYSSFVVFMVGMVVMAFREDFDLVADDYYEQEIAYQGRIEQLTNASDDEQKVSVLNADGAIELTFPSKATAVNVHFFRPSDEKMDLKVEEAAVDSVLSVPTDQLTRGKYLVKVGWNANGKTYFQEENLFVN